ncbi:rab-GTPase-TBC domain-containing protein [Glomus cerebriforme]|uniref:Rab-GTPase-TBC domain-containing protein n=1 Tax=Glomus cerebriforme TaxID=658196 RepID=A0A397SXU8_9GLOM|nr:rab-GTPase-TBC domain-containing protein [Glomus cerebriforme]
MARNYIIKTKSAIGALPRGELNKDLLARLEHENSQLPPQNSTEFLLARLERQNNILDNDPKSVCIQSNVLKANFETVQSLIDDINTSPTNENEMADLIPILKEEKKDDETSKTIDWDFWSALIQDYSSVATKLPHLLSAKLQQGLPPKLRGLVWQSMCQASSTYLETMYSQLLSESSPYDRIIQRDLARTFPHIEMFKEENGKGQTMLWNVLKAYSLYDSLVGYCQGLGFLVGPLLMNMSEAQAFCVFVRLMETYDMRTMFTLNMEGLQLRLYQFSALLSQILPKLHVHFQLHAIHAAMFASQWFLSLFAYTYPLPLVLRIYDVVFAEGAPETIMRVAIALLKKNEASLLEINEFEDLLEFLTSQLYEAYDNEPTGLIKDAMGLSNVITKAKLDQLNTNYLKELEDQKKRAEKLVAIRFNGRFNNKSQNEKNKEIKQSEKRDKPKRWSFTALPSSRQSVASVSSLNSVSNDVSNSDNENTTTSSLAQKALNSGLLHQQIEDLALALSQLQKEHADVTEQLVIVKMEKMDLVTELEGLKKNIRGLEKENKRMSSSMYSIGFNEYNEEGATLSRRTSTSGSSFILASGPNQSPEDIDLTPRPSTEVRINNIHKRRTSDSDVFNKPRRGSATSFMSMSRLYSTSSTSSILSQSTNNTQSTSISTPDASEFGEIDFNENKNGVPSESALTDELIQVKMEKFELMQENDDLHKIIAESENSLKNSQLANEALQEKNVFLRGEIERLDEEVTQAVYEQSVMEQQIKEVKNLRLQNVKLVKEKEKINKEMEILKAKVAMLEGPGRNAVFNDDDVIYDNDNVVQDDNDSNKSRRSSFMNFFTGNTSDESSSPILRRGSVTAKSTSNFAMDGEDLPSINAGNEYELSDDLDEFDIIPQCNGECFSAKRVEELEHMLADVKLRLAESEESRETMSAQLNGLRMLINGYSNEEARPMSPGNAPKSRQEKRASTMSLTSFFSGS